MTTVDRAALDDLAALLLERAGLKIAPDGFHGLRLALRERMPALGVTDAGEYVRRLRQRTGEGELRLLLPLVTVGHTEFFRDGRQFQALERRILPEALARARNERRKVSIWSAGCATGEEPYSLAMVLAELGALPREVRLLATDVNVAAVESAEVGRFPQRRLASVSPARRERFFRPAGQGAVATDELKGYIEFAGQNLAAPVFERTARESLDVILCRNVIIYFDLPTIRGLMGRFLEALRPGGFLLLGYSESLFKVYERFEMVEVEGAFVYRRPTGLSPPTSPMAPPRRPVAPTSSPEFPSVSELRGRRGESRGKAPDPTAIQGATRPTGPPPPTAGGESSRSRAALPGIRSSEALPPAPAARVPQPPDRLQAIGLRVDRGDFNGALLELQTLSREAPGELGVLLALGNLYSLLGRGEAARQTFDEALAREPLCVEARVYAALAELQASRNEHARDELGKALFLEPTLAIAHYLMGQVHEKLKDREAARRAYRNALSQLRYPQRPLAGYYPDLATSAENIERAAEYALDALDATP